MATLYKASGEQVEVKPAQGGSFTLEEVQQHVDGYFQAQRLPDGKLMLMDEDGKMKQKPVNRAASILLFGQLAGVADVVVGDVLVGTKKELGG